VTTTTLRIAMLASRIAVSSEAGAPASRSQATIRSSRSSTCS
jgi:hypothetical protein